MFKRLLLLSCCGLALALAGPARGDGPARKPARPQVEVVFCLDTTGSMGGLIDAAKQKIWSISNQIAAGKPTPRLKIGLVAYRDRGDAYVTKVFDLTDDLDAIHGHLMSFRAEGGGDFPESVNEALHDAVTKITWSKDKKTLKLIFLVGDAPPHMDYANDVKYPETCKKAVKNDIIINTVQCGNHPETQKYWKEICRLAEGSYVQISAEGGAVHVVRTPFDTELATINGKMAGTTIAFGSVRRQAEAKARTEATKALPAPAAADRAGFYAAAGGPGGGAVATYDLVDAVKKGTVKLDKLKKEELPPALQNLTLKQQTEYLKKVEDERAALNRRAAELNTKRNTYIAKKQAEERAGGRPRDSFDSQVLGILERQATRSGIRYEAPEQKRK
jgi:Mg-chelatase subunit ChlD